MRVAIQLGIALLIFGFLVLTVVNQWDQIRASGVHFQVEWLIPAFVILPIYYALNALAWDLILRFLGFPIGVLRAQVVWGQPLLARYVPGSVLYVLARLVLSERAGVPRRITIASLVYEQALSLTAAVSLAAYFVIIHPDLQGQPIRWAVVLVVPAAIVVLHPRIFGPLANRLLGAFGREPLPETVPLRGVLLMLVYFTLNWCLAGLAVYFVARSVFDIPFSEVATVGSAQALGYVAALLTIVAPAGLGVRDAAFAWGVKAALPAGSFAVGSLIAIAVRGVLTIVELFYVGIVTLIARREGWSIKPGDVAAAAEEQEVMAESESS